MVSIYIDNGNIVESFYVEKSVSDSISEILKQATSDWSETRPGYGVQIFDKYE